MSVVSDPGSRGDAAHQDHSSAVGPAWTVAPVLLSSSQDVFGLRRTAQQAAAALSLERQDQVRLATALSELGRDRLGCRGLEVSFGLVPPGRPTALLVTFVWSAGPPPARETLDLAAKLVGIEYEARPAGGRIVVSQPLSPEAGGGDEQHARLAEVLKAVARSTEADDLRAQTRDLIATLEETRAQREELQPAQRRAGGDQPGCPRAVHRADAGAGGHQQRCSRAAHRTGGQAPPVAGGERGQDPLLDEHQP